MNRFFSREHRTALTPVAVIPSAMIRVFAGLLILLAAGAAGHAAPPNVILIVADDLGWRDLGAQGSSYYESPRIDSLARSGLRFEQGYATCQVCSPSRASVMTGRLPARVGITDYIGAAMGDEWQRNTELLPATYVPALPKERVTIAEALKEAGYATFFAGKWHLGNDETDWPEYHGYDINKGGHSRGTPPGGFFSPYQNPRLTDGPPGESLPLRLGRETASFVEAHADRPFFATLWFYSVHAPAQTTRDRWEKFRVKASEQPEPELRYAMGRRRPIRQVQDNPIYAGMIETMDEAVGYVLDSVERLGLTENTIVIFTSDNGGVASGDHWATSNLPLRGGKGYQWEGGLRVPFIISWPGSIKPGVDSGNLATGADLYPTLLELAGLPLRPQEHVDGISLVPALQGKTLPERPLIWHYPHYGNQGGDPSSISRLGDWKLIRYHETKSDELYRLSEDPMETTDVALMFPKRARRLGERLDAWLKEVGASIPRPNPNFDAKAYKEELERNLTTIMPRLEEEAAALLEPDWKPNPTWWGSEPGL